MKRQAKISGLLSVWFVVSSVLGLALTYIPWGRSDGFHGKGIPFAQVYWDRSPGTDRLIDFPNPFAPPLNIAAVFVAGIPAMLFARWIIGWFRS